jgi:hypothetical protein
MYLYTCYTRSIKHSLIENAYYAIGFTKRGSDDRLVTYVIVFLAEGVPGGGNAIEVGLQGAIGFVRIATADRINDAICC